MNKSDGLQPHIHLSKDARYQRAIVCGAPERVALIAEKLKGPKKVAQNREYVSYLGEFDSKPILVTSHGVGSAGAAICFNELMNVGVQTIVRLGTAGGLQDSSNIGDLVIPTAAVREDGVTRLMIPATFPAISDFELTHRLIKECKTSKLAAITGVILTSDLFYPSLLPINYELYQKAGVQAVEMECSTLFVTALIRKVRAASILVLDGNPLKWSEGNYDPKSEKLAASIDRAAEVILKVLSSEE